MLPCVEIEADGLARAAVVWLHGLGADGHDFEPIVPYLGLDRSLGVRFVFPHAPRRAVTINMGLIMPAWYDIRDTDLSRDHDVAGIRDSAAEIEVLLARERERGVPASRTVLAGFSQGGAMALYAGLRHAERLAGILALSCYLLEEGGLGRDASCANRDAPIFQAHGLMDPVVPVSCGEACRKRLEAGGWPVTWRTYPMGHEVHPDEIADVGAWLADRLRNGVRA